MSETPTPEEKNLRGWLRELCDLTAPEQLDALAQLLFVEGKQDEFRARVRRIMQISAHLHTVYDIDNDEWVVAQRALEIETPDDEVEAYYKQAPSLSEDLADRMREIADIMCVTHFRMKNRLAAIEQEETAECAPTIADALDMQPTSLQPPEEKRHAA